jgi:energy-coupling factor transport system ATP-binding protein
MGFLELNNVSFNYAGQGRQIFNDLNLSIFKEGVTAVTGLNGSGKTTLSKLLIGILQPTKGWISLNGKFLTTLTLAQIGRQIGYVFQNPDKQLFCETVVEEIGFGMHNLGLPADQVARRVEEMMEYFELARYSQVFPLNLSAGEKRRLAIAAVLALEPDLVVLDEPTTGLDPYRKGLLGNYLEKILALKKGVVIISHDHKFIARYANRFIKLEEGKPPIIEG